MDCTFDIGGLTLRLDGAPWSPASMPRNFRPFVCREETGQPEGAMLEIKSSAGQRAMPSSEPLSVSYNDLGKASLYEADDAWCIALTPRPGEEPRLMYIDKALTRATLWLHDADPYADFVIDSMTRIFFSQYAATRGGLVLHASVVGYEGRAYLFMGKSGTGKSTHSRLWMECFEGCTLLNDDCPLVTPAGSDTFMACGTPWSGKTPCWRNLRLPIGGIARLRQAPANRFIPLSGIESFVAFIPGMSVMTSDKRLYAEATSTALHMLENLPMGILECLPDRAAARLSYQYLS